MHSSQSPSIVVNIASVWLGSPALPHDPDRVRDSVGRQTIVSH